MQVLTVLLVVPADPSVGEFTALFLSAVPGIQVYGIIELLQGTVMPDGLLPVSSIRPFLWMEPPHGKGIVDMVLWKVQALALPLCGDPIGNMNIHFRGCFL